MCFGVALGIEVNYVGQREYRGHAFGGGQRKHNSVHAHAQRQGVDKQCAQCRAAQGGYDQRRLYP